MPKTCAKQLWRSFELETHDGLETKSVQATQGGLSHGSCSLQALGKFGACPTLALLQASAHAGMPSATGSADIT